VSLNAAISKSITIFFGIHPPNNSLNFLKAQKYELNDLLVKKIYATGNCRQKTLACKT
jgi:hypothetical protein